MELAGAVLAAGEGRRFRASGGAGPKVLARVGGRRLVDLAVDAAQAGGVARLAVVVGGAPLELTPPGVTVLANERWADGIATSLAVAIDWADALGVDALLVGLADQPGVGSEAWRSVADAPDDSPVAVATYPGGRGHPVRLLRSVWPLLPRTGDEGARVLMRERPELVHEVACTGDPGDVDDVADLARWA
jgi:CTP:molybdopterin cytidylyltransferase MocA